MLPPSKSSQFDELIVSFCFSTFHVYFTACDADNYMVSSLRTPRSYLCLLKKGSIVKNLSFRWQCLDK